MTGLSDSFHRPIDYLRVSVTDRCNLRCVYCMPPDGVCLMPHQDLLTFEELHLVARAAVELGITKVRLTGGEPLVRLGLPKLVEMLAEIPGIEDVSLTTNGLLLGQYADKLKKAGLRRVNVSLDTLNPDRFRTISRSKYSPEHVLDGIEAAQSAGLTPVKINMVVMGGVNDDEIVEFAARSIAGWNVRFIEVMPLAGEGGSPGQFIPVSEIRKRIEKLGALEQCQTSAGNGPARYFRLPGAKGTIGFITPVTEHFCFSCNRLRLTSDGRLRPCLLSGNELDLRQAVRSGASLDGIKALIKKAVASKPQKHHMTGGEVPRGRPFSQVGG